MLHKINVILTIPVYIAFCIHTILCTLTMCGIIAYEPVSGIIGKIMYYLLLVHTAVGVFFIFRRLVIKTRKNIKMKIHPRLLFKQLSGFVVIVLMFFHGSSFGSADASGGFIIYSPTIGAFLLNFTITVLFGLHCACTFPDACKTLGIMTKNNILPVLIISNILSWLPVLIGVVGCIIYYRMAFYNLVISIFGI